MPIILTDGTNLAKADNSYDALRVCYYPNELTSKHIVSMESGTITGVAAGITNIIAAMRQIDSASVIHIRKIQLGWVTATGFTAAQYMDFGVYIVRSYSASSSGGTPWSGASNNGKIRTSLGVPTSIDARIATTTALTAGTFTADTNPIAQCGCYNAAGVAGGYIPMTILLDQGPGDYPLILAQNEGLVICPMTAMGAGGAGFLMVVIEGCSSATY
jgi:hypothetical protein